MSPRLVACAVCFFVLCAAPSARAQAPPGGPGDDCRARSGCQAGLACRDHVCTYEGVGDSCETSSDCGSLECVTGVCMVPFRRRPKTRTDWMRFRFTWLHPFFGTALVAGPVFMTGANGAYNLRSSGWLWALRAGVYAGRGELAVEASPLSYRPMAGLGPSFQFNGTYGYLFPLREAKDVSVYWPLRAGVGLLAGNSLGLAFFIARADPVGLTLRVGHVLVDIHAPSLRYAVSFVNDTSIHLVAVDFGGGVTYAF